VATINIFTRAGDAEAVEPGQVLFEQGDPGDVMYAVAEGAVDIVHNGRVVETVTAGGIFGELALVDDSPRSARAVAGPGTRLVSIDKRRFEFLVQEHPTFALQVMSVLAARLRNSNDT
jgi:CRP/FNR family transcriptional regulator, cyclic AMP receptor protein